MKKLITIFLAVMLIVSCTIAVSAENATPNVTTLTTTVPDAEYTLNIPADQKIEFGAISTDIGDVSVSNSKNFAAGKNLQVTVTYDAFKSSQLSTTIPFVIKHYATWSMNNDSKEVVKEKSLKTLESGNKLIFHGKTSGTVYEHTSTKVEGFSGEAYDEGIFVKNYLVVVNSADWGKALAGDYTATITFSAEVVVE